MGNQQGTAESLDCSKELDRIEYQLNEYERQAGNKLESNVVIDAKELALLKHNLEKIQINQLDTLHDRYTMDKNLKSRRKVLTKRLLAFLARVDAKEKLMNLIPGSTAAIHKMDLLESIKRIQLVVFRLLYADNHRQVQLNVMIILMVYQRNLQLLRYEFVTFLPIIYHQMERIFAKINELK